MLPSRSRNPIEPQLFLAKGLGQLGYCSCNERFLVRTPKILLVTEIYLSSIKFAGVVKLVDTLCSERSEGNLLRVRIPSLAQFFLKNKNSSRTKYVSCG